MEARSSTVTLESNRTATDAGAPRALQPSKDDADVGKQAASSPLPALGPAPPPGAGPPAKTLEEVKAVQQSKRRWLLLVVFSVAMFLDVANRSGSLVFVESISADLEIPYDTTTWILNSYTITFGAVLPLCGRLADLFSARSVFLIGFAGFALCQIIISVLPSQYAFFVFRGLAGCFAGATIPAAFRLIASVFVPAEIPKAMAVFTIAASTGNSLGLVFGGIVGIISDSGQMSGWRWFFRIIGFICIPFSLVAFRWCPKTTGSRAGEGHKWQQVDLPGALLIFAPLTLLILGLIFGASYGWRTAKFLVPFLLSWPLFVGFFMWEARLPPRDALVPPSFWKTQNVAIILFAAIAVFPWWTTIQLPLVERFERIYGESRILSAVRCLPIGVGALLMGYLTPKILPRLNIRATLSIAMFVAGCMFLLLIYSHAPVIEHAAYWRYIFPALLVGSGTMGVAFTTINIAIMMSVPREMTGVAGGFLQVANQIGSALGIAIQSGLLSIHPGNVENFTNVQISWWAQFGWEMVVSILLAVFLRDPRKAKADVESQEKRGEAKRPDEG